MKDRLGAPIEHSSQEVVMPCHRRVVLLFLAGLATVTLGLARKPARWPPWLSIEYPPSPYDRTTRDAVLLVHVFRGGSPPTRPSAVPLT